MDYDRVNIDGVFGVGNAAELVKYKQRRKLPVLGDYFGVEVAGRGWIAGRVIRENPSQMPGAEQGPFDETYLVYLYKGLTENPPEPGDLPRPPDLRLPPIVVDREVWTRGFVVPICSSELEAHERLPYHCFFDRPRREPFDEFGRTLDKITFPCSAGGVSMLSGFRKWIGYSLENEFDQNSHPLS